MLREASGAFFQGLAESTRPLDLAAWADANRIMPEGSPCPGPWRTDYMPPARAVMDAYCDLDCREITLVSATQMLKTEALLNMIFASVLADPAHVMYVTPDKDLARTIANERIRPAAAAMPDVSAAMETNVVHGRARGQSWNQKIWPGGSLTMAWPDSRSGLISRPIRIVLLDEVDRYKKTDVYESVLSRGVRFGASFKLVSCSSPEDMLTSLIWRRYLMGSRGKFSGRCVYCDKLDYLDWEKNVSWEQAPVTGLPMPETAKYVCGSCGEVWSDGDRVRAIDAGEYVHEDDANRAHRTFWVNRLADKHVPLVSIVEKCRNALVAAKKDSDYAPFRRFMADEIAQPWRNRDRVASAEDLNARLLNPRQVDNHLLLSEDVDIIVVSVDVQDDRLEVDIGGWGWHKGKETARYFGLGYHKIPGELTGTEVWADLDKILTRVWKRAGNRGDLEVSICVIDTGGHHMGAVKDYIETRKGMPIYPLKGVTNTRNLTAIRVPPKPSEGWERKRLIQVGTNVIKDWVASHSRADKFEKPGERVLEWYKGLTYDLAYFEGLTSEEKVRHEVGGRVTFRWEHVTRSKRNEPLDLMVYSHAGMVLFAYIALKKMGVSAIADEWKRFYKTGYEMRQADKDARKGKVVRLRRPKRGEPEDEGDYD